MIKLMLEWVTWVMTFLTWAILVRVALKRQVKNHQYSFSNERKVWWWAMGGGILIFILCVLFVSDPVTAFFVGMDYVAPANGPYLFLIVSLIIFLTLPFLTTAIVCRVFRKKE
ncbi:MAG: hypothetical protein U0Y08_02045 [Bacteroidia bacterium]